MNPSETTKIVIATAIAASVGLISGGELSKSEVDAVLSATTTEMVDKVKLKKDELTDEIKLSIDAVVRQQEIYKEVEGKYFTYEGDENFEVHYFTSFENQGYYIIGDGWTIRNDGKKIEVEESAARIATTTNIKL